MLLLLSYHTIPFILAVTLTHVNWHHFSMIYLLWKIVIISDLRLTSYIIYIDLSIVAFSLQTTFNDPCLIQFILYLTKMMGE